MRRILVTAGPASWGATSVNTFSARGTTSPASITSSAASKEQYPSSVRPPFLRADPARRHPTRSLLSRPDLPPGLPPPPHPLPATRIKTVITNGHGTINMLVVDGGAGAGQGGEIRSTSIKRGGMTSCDQLEERVGGQ